MENSPSHPQTETDTFDHTCFRLEPYREQTLPQQGVEYDCHCDVVRHYLSAKGRRIAYPKRVGLADALWHQRRYLHQQILDGRGAVRHVA
jgi:hypothetical protein